jgi:steroid 5-alpha reductase family enzyme
MMPLLVALSVLLALLALLWLVSLRLSDASIIDPFWGPAFGVLALAVAVQAPRVTSQGAVLIAAVIVWGARLGGYLLWRNHGKGEDPRYVAMRARNGAAWWWRSLFVVFVLQGVIAWGVALPITLALAAAQEAPWLALAPGLAVFTIGFACEAIADAQLARFKRDPANRGAVMDRGLWRYSRHPNYFGNACLMWGLYLIAVPLGAPWWTALGPLLMTWLLLRVSGVTLLERSLRETKPAYADYVRRTSAFVPWPPRAA